MARTLTDNNRPDVDDGNVKSAGRETNVSLSAFISRPVKSDAATCCAISVTLSEVNTDGGAPMGSERLTLTAVVSTDVTIDVMTLRVTCE